MHKLKGSQDRGAFWSSKLDIISAKETRFRNKNEGTVSIIRLTSNHESNYLKEKLQRLFFSKSAHFERHFMSLKISQFREKRCSNFSFWQFDSSIKSSGFWRRTLTQATQKCVGNLRKYFIIRNSYNLHTQELILPLFLPRLECR